MRVIHTSRIGRVTSALMVAVGLSGCGEPNPCRDASADTAPRGSTGTTEVASTVEEPTERPATESGDLDTGDSGGDGSPIDCTRGEYPGKFLGGDLDALRGYTSIAELVVSGVDEPDLSDLSCLERADAVRIEASGGLKSLHGLERLAYVKALLWIEGNGELESLEGLSGLRQVDGWLVVSGNPRLRSLRGLEALATAKMMSVIRNADLVSLDGLGGLKVVRETLEIIANPKLATFGGPLNLDEVSHLQIEENQALVRLDGLESLRTIGTSLLLADNAALVNVSALEGAKLATTDASVTIADNASLPACSAQALLEAIQPPGWMGWLKITGNLGTCP